MCSAGVEYGGWRQCCIEQATVLQHSAHDLSSTGMHAYLPEGFLHKLTIALSEQHHPAEKRRPTARGSGAISPDWCGPSSATSSDDRARNQSPSFNQLVLDPQSCGAGPAFAHSRSAFYMPGLYMREAAHINLMRPGFVAQS